MKYYLIYGWDDCPFCESARELLQTKGVKHMYVSLDHDEALLEHFKKYYDWPTVPIIVEILEEKAPNLVGGYTDLCAHLESK